jgi:hypothetical protein
MQIVFSMWAFPAGMINTSIILWYAVSVVVLVLYGASIDADIVRPLVIRQAAQIHLGPLFELSEVRVCYT